MASARKHLRNGRRHFDAAMLFGGDPIGRSWAAVALFYSAHQLVHAVLDGEGALAEEMRHPLTHGRHDNSPGTSTLVAQLYREIDLAYKSLFGTGKGVRYDGQLVAQSDFDDLLRLDYRTIREWARARLESQGRTLGEDWP